MTDLNEKHCTPCEGGTPALSSEQATGLLANLDEGWSTTGEGKAIERTFKFKDFYRTVAFVNAVAWIANREDHHPDLSVHYGKCVVRYSTHAVDGLTENDFICAAKIDRLVGDD